MALAFEANTSLAFDTVALSEYGNRYGKIAEELRKMSDELDKCLSELKSSGWTSEAGQEFHKMANINWRKNIEKYADLLDTLKTILVAASSNYDSLVTNYVETTRF